MAIDPVESVLTAALSYAARGWRVLPIKPGQKRPPMTSWQDAATTDTATITSWFTALYRDHGVGIATGPGSGIWVLDVDDYEALRDLERAHAELPETLTSITGRGGFHLLFAWPADGREPRNNQSGKVAPGIDVRGEGGQIVAPPTVHPNGTTYQWDASCDTIAQAPEWLLELVCAPPPTLNPQPPREVHGDRPGDLWAATVDWADILTADGWTLHHTDRSGERHWTRPGKDRRDGTSATTGYTANDNLKVFTSSVPGLDAEGVYTKLGYLAATRHDGDHSAAARALAEAGHRSDGPNLDDLLTVPHAQGPEGTQGGEVGNPLAKWLVDWPTFYATDHTATEWILEPLFAARRAHALYAGAKTGKSWLVLAACAAVASGRPFLDHPGGDPVDVLYVDYEMTPDDLHERLTSFGYDDPHELAHLHYALLPSLPPLDTERGGLALSMAAQAVGAEFVVIDTTSRATQGDENESQTFKEFYRHTGLLLKQHGIGWMRLDHAGKDPERGQRGSSAKNDDVDLVLRLSRTDDGLEVKATHRRIGWYPERITITAREDGYGVTRFSTSEGAKPYLAGTREMVARLEALEVPVEWGRKRVAEFLKVRGERYSTSVLADAIRFRKVSAGGDLGALLAPKNGHGHPHGHPSYPQATDTLADTLPKTPETQGRTPSRTPLDTSPDASTDTPAPLKGAGGPACTANDDEEDDLGWL